jgi:N utilization substance protein A
MSKEILMVVESVSLEKGVPKEVIIDALEHALAMATKKRYQENAEFRVSINRDTWRVFDVPHLEGREPGRVA